MDVIDAVAANGYTPRYLLAVSRFQRIPVTANPAVCTANVGVPSTSIMTRSKIGHWVNANPAGGS